MDKLDFHIKIEKLIDEEKKKFGGSESKLAKAIGIPQPTLNNIKNNAKEPPPTKSIVDAFISYFKNSNPEIYDIFGVSRPDPYSVLEGLPTGFIEATIAAHSEYIEAIAAKGISEGSPEAVKISKEILEKHGIHFTDTE